MLVKDEGGKKGNAIVFVFWGGLGIILLSWLAG